MIEHIVSTMEAVGINDIVVVVGHGKEAIQNYLGDRVQYAYQEEQLGTGHAVLQTEPILGGKAGCTLVVNGDNPLITVQTYDAFLRDFHTERTAASVLTAILDVPDGYGRVVRSENGRVERIVEHADATGEERCIREISTGTFCFDNRTLFHALKKVKNDNAQGEYYLPDVLGVLVAEGRSIRAFCVDDPQETVGINDRVQLAEAEAILRNRILRFHMEAGVTVVDPNQTYIESDVVIGADTIIYPGTMLRGKTVIGENCVIGPNADIRDCQLGDGVTVEHSTLRQSEIREGTTIGPYAYVRPGSVIGAHVKIGNFVEVKNSVIGQGTKVPHLSYVGDSELGQGVNIGCGAITVNYDGERKWRTTVGDETFIGCNVNLVAPVAIGSGAYVAAGSTVTEDVPDNSFAIARERQTTKEQYVPKLKAKRRRTEHA